MKKLFKNLGLSFIFFLALYFFGALHTNSFFGYFTIALVVSLFAGSILLYFKDRKQKLD